MTTDKELVLTRVIDVPREKLWRCWTEPQLIVQWFTPPPFKTVHAETDVRPGGSSYILMKGPEGQEMPNRGVYLEVVENEKLVFTDAYHQSVGAVGQAVLHRHPDLRGRRERQDKVHGAGRALDPGRLRGPREDGLPSGLGHRHRPDDGAGEDVIM